jgi:hypothetical protein
MAYDTDKTPAILTELRAALDAGKIPAAVRLLRFADKSGTVRSDVDLLPPLRTAVGAEHAESLVKALAFDTCPYCTAGRDRCEDCAGKGVVSGVKMCAQCAGLGMKRCSFCNGTALAGYGFIPRGLTLAVLKIRVAFAKNQIAALTKSARNPPTTGKDLAKMILSLDRARGMLANAVEQARIHAQGAPGTRVLFSKTEAATIEREARQINEQAEETIRGLLKSLAGLYARRAGGTGDDTRRHLAAHRAKHFANLSEGDRLNGTTLRTPHALRPGK